MFCTICLHICFVPCVYIAVSCHVSWQLLPAMHPSICALPFVYILFPVIRPTSCCLSCVYIDVPCHISKHLLPGLCLHWCSLLYVQTSALWLVSALVFPAICPNICSLACVYIGIPCHKSKHLLPGLCLHFIPYHVQPAVAWLVSTLVFPAMFPTSCSPPCVSSLNMAICPTSCFLLCVYTCVLCHMSDHFLVMYLHSCSLHRFVATMTTKSAGACWWLQAEDND
jgi:hypothetical protein